MSCTVAERADGVGAGEDEPVVIGKRAQRSIKRREIRRRPNLDDRNFNRLGSDCPQALAEFAGLVSGARYENAPASERQRFHQAAPPAVLLPAASNAPAPSANKTSAASRPNEAGSVFLRGACK